MKNFKTLWNNFPEKKTIFSRCFNKQDDSSAPFSDYCAILLSECLIKSNINIANYKGNKCWSHTGKKHILLAEKLADGLRLSPPSHFSIMTKIDPKRFQEILEGKTGVIFFKNYWQRGRENFDNRSGDHIDLWNKDEITSSGMLMRSVYEFFGVLSDLNKSQEVWFWEVK
mgnify:CR=1 FL=1